MPKTTVLSAVELEEQFIQKGGSSPTVMSPLSKEDSEPVAEPESEDSLHRFTLRMPKSQKESIEGVINQSAIRKRLGITHFILEAIEEKLAREKKAKAKN